MGPASFGHATGPLYRGLSQYLGMPVRPVRDTKYPEADLRDRLRLAKELPGYDFVYVHTKAPDVAAHTKDPRIKKRVIEILDRAFAYALNEIVTDPNLLLVITADHSTNSAGRMIHSGESVPLTMIGAYTRRDAVTRFDESGHRLWALSAWSGGRNSCTSSLISWTGANSSASWILPSISPSPPDPLPL